MPVAHADEDRQVQAGAGQRLPQTVRLAIGELVQR
jgi:hypothetical protein